MKISIIGSGYVGLVTGACFADLGHQVLCMDDDPGKIALLKAGGVPLYEPGLPELIKTNVEEKRLFFTTHMEEAVKSSGLIFLCVGTPPKPNGEADLSIVELVGKRIGQYRNGYKLIVEKSTVPVQTAEWLEKIIQNSMQGSGDFDIASNPEFLREGNAIQDFLHPDRVVLGVSNQRAASLLMELYEPLNSPLLITDIKSAELIKHASNAFLAMKISFINAVAEVCERTGADIAKVARGVGLDSRIGSSFLQAGIGYGGACFPKDLSAFIHLAEKSGYDFRLLKAVAEINEKQRKIPVEKIRKILGNFQGKQIGLWGLSFKPQTDDLRGAVSLEILEILLSEGAKVRVFDPVAMENAKKIFPRIFYARDPYEAVEECDAVILVTEWPVFKYLNLMRVKERMKSPVLFDGRNVFSPARMVALGFEYYGIGRPVPVGTPLGVSPR